MTYPPAFLVTGEWKVFSSKKTTISGAESGSVLRELKAYSSTLENMGGTQGMRS